MATDDTDLMAEMDRAMGPDRTRPAPFDYHRCYRCDSGARPCVHGSPSGCEYLRARNE